MIETIETDTQWIEKRRSGHSVMVVWHEGEKVSIEHLTAHNQRPQGHRSVLTKKNFLKRYSRLEITPLYPKLEPDAVQRLMDAAMEDNPAELDRIIYEFSKEEREILTRTSDALRYAVLRARMRNMDYLE